MGCNQPDDATYRMGIALTVHLIVHLPRIPARAPAAASQARSKSALLRPWPSRCVTDVENPDTIIEDAIEDLEWIADQRNDVNARALGVQGRKRRHLA